MVEVGSMPILWHIMKIYSSFGVNDFIVCCGYKGHYIKEYFSNYFLRNSDVTFDVRGNEMKVIRSSVEPWRVTLIDTGENTMTGGRLKRVREHLDDETFCFTYGDGVCDVNINSLLKFHREQGVEATLTAVQPPGRFGAFSLSADQAKIDHFKEKPTGDNAWINGGYFVLEPSVIDRIAEDSTTWEAEPMESLAKEGQLAAYMHRGFWQPMDTLRDKTYLEDLWKSGEAPWKVW